MSYYATLRLIESSGPGSVIQLVFSESGIADKWWSAAQSNASALAEGAKGSDFKRPRSNWMVLPGVKPEAINKLCTHEAWAAINDQWGIAATTSSSSDEESAGGPAEKLDHITSQVAELSEKVDKIAAAGGVAGAGDAGAAGGDHSNWNNGKLWIGGIESYKLVDKAYKTSLQKKDEGDDRGFSMIFSQEMMELRRRYRG